MYRALDANFISLPTSEPASRQCLGAYRSPQNGPLETSAFALLAVRVKNSLRSFDVSCGTIPQSGDLAVIAGGHTVAYHIATIAFVAI
jgi:hypothetical protein